MNNKVLKIHPSDNVLVALQDLPRGEVVQYQTIRVTLVGNVSAKHKIFVTDMPAGADVIMYGVLVGKTSQPVTAGSVMNTENVKHAAGNYSYRGSNYHWTPPDVSKFKN